MQSVLLSNAQAKLEAIMSKMTDILPFIPDQDCEAAFAVLSSVAQGVLDQRSAAKATSFKKMTLSELVTLAKPDQGCLKKKKIKSWPYEICRRKRSR